MGYTPHALVIGGGVVGTGIARDLAIRGLDVTLVARGPLVGGTQTDRILYSGARFAQNPSLAKRLSQERQTLSSIASYCIDETWGLLLSLDSDDDSRFQETLDAVRSLSLPHENLDSEAIRNAESALSEDVSRGMKVPDAVVDPVELTLALARSASEYDATIRPHTSVTDIATDGGTIDTVTVSHDPPPEPESGPAGPTKAPGGDGGGSRRRRDTPGGTPGIPGPEDSTTDEASETESDGAHVEELDPEYVINAAGPRVEAVAGMAGIDLDVSHVGDTNRVVDGVTVDSVVTRVHEDGHATIAPGARGAVLGPAQTALDGEDDSPVSLTAIEDLTDALARVVPAVETAPTVRTYGVLRARHPSTEETVDATLVDHGDRDDCWGMTTVVGGSVTTHRLVAERVVDDVCGKFGITRACQTDETPLPERTPTEGTGELLCDCCHVRRGEVRSALDDDLARTVDLEEVALRTGATMSECQGRRCAHRLAAELYDEYDEEVVADALEDLCRSRWREQRQALAGDELRGTAQTYRFRTETMNLPASDMTYVDSRSKQVLDAIENDDAVPMTTVGISAFDDGQRGRDRERPPWGERPL